MPRLQRVIGSVERVPDKSGLKPDDDDVTVRPPVVHYGESDKRQRPSPTTLDVLLRILRIRFLLVISPPCRDGHVSQSFGQPYPYVRQLRIPEMSSQRRESQSVIAVQRLLLIVDHAERLAVDRSKPELLTS